MKKIIRQYRNMNDFQWGSFQVRTGSAWMQINGKLKKTGAKTVFIEILFKNGHGTVIEDINQSE